MSVGGGGEVADLSAAVGGGVAGWWGGWLGVERLPKLLLMLGTQQCP